MSWGRDELHYVFGWVFIVMTINGGGGCSAADLVQHAHHPEIKEHTTNRGRTQVNTSLENSPHGKWVRCFTATVWSVRHTFVLTNNMRGNFKLADYRKSASRPPHFILVSTWQLFCFSKGALTHLKYTLHTCRLLHMPHCRMHWCPARYIKHRYVCVKRQSRRSTGGIKQWSRLHFIYDPLTVG